MSKWKMKKIFGINFCNGNRMVDPTLDKCLTIGKWDVAVYFFFPLSTFPFLKYLKLLFTGIVRGNHFRKSDTYIRAGFLGFTFVGTKPSNLSKSVK